MSAGILTGFWDAASALMDRGQEVGFMGQEDAGFLSDHALRAILGVLTVFVLE